MTKKEAAIVMAFTGKMLGDFSTFHEYAEKIMGTPIFTHQFGDKELMARLKEKARPDFVALEVI